jgi:hypothetical protein
VEGLGVDTEDLLHFAIEDSQIGSQYMKDRPRKLNRYETFCEVDGITIHAIINNNKGERKI